MVRSLRIIGSGAPQCQSDVIAMIRSVQSPSDDAGSCSFHLEISKMHNIAHKTATGNMKAMDKVSGIVGSMAFREIVTTFF